jgi:hypothetical protein
MSCISAASRFSALSFFLGKIANLFHIAIASDISDNMESNLYRRSINRKGQNMVLKIGGLNMLQMLFELERHHVFVRANVLAWRARFLPRSDFAILVMT